MIEIYTAILDRLKNNVPELQWINLDSGEIDDPEGNYACPFPACLVDFENTEWTTKPNGVQDGDVTVLIRIAFDIVEDINKHTPETTRNAAVSKLQLINKIHSYLQGYGSEYMKKLDRVQSEIEKRADRLKVFNIRYRTNYTDVSAQQDWTLVTITGFDVEKKAFPIVPEPDPEPETDPVPENEE